MRKMYFLVLISNNCCTHMIRIGMWNIEHTWIQNFIFFFCMAIMLWDAAYMHILQPAIPWKYIMLFVGVYHVTISLDPQHGIAIYFFRIWGVRFLKKDSFSTNKYQLQWNLWFVMLNAHMFDLTNDLQFMVVVECLIFKERFFFHSLRSKIFEEGFFCTNKYQLWWNL